MQMYCGGYLTAVFELAMKYIPGRVLLFLRIEVVSCEFVTNASDCV